MNNQTYQCESKHYRTCIKDYNWNPCTCICENGKYLKNFADDSKIVYDEIMYVMDVASTNLTNIIPTNVTNTILANVTSIVPSNFHKKVRYKMDCYILHTVLLVIKLLLIITIVCYHYSKHWSKLEKMLLC